MQVVIGAVLGIAIGLLFPRVGVALKPLNDWFIALVKMIVAPVIFVVVPAVATMDNVRRVGKIGIKALVYFIGLSLLSMLIGLIVGNIFKPGAGMNIDASTLDATASPAQRPGGRVRALRHRTHPRIPVGRVHRRPRSCRPCWCRSSSVSR